MPNQDCLAHSLIALFRSRFPRAYDRGDPSTGPPSSETPLHLATLREEQQDDGAPQPTMVHTRRAQGWFGWYGHG